MKTTKIIVFAFIAILLISMLSLVTSAQIDEADLDENSKLYYRLANEFTEDYISFISDDEISDYTNRVSGFGECENLIRQTAYYLKGRTTISQEIEFAVNNIILDQNGGNIHIVVKTTEGNNLDLFIRISFPQKVIAITDIYIMGNKQLENILYTDDNVSMTLENFVTWASEMDEEDYADMANYVSISTNVESNNPPTSDVNTVQWIFIIASSVCSCFVFKKHK